MVHRLPVRSAFVTLVLMMLASGGEDSAAIAQAAAAQNPAQTSGQPAATPPTPAQPATQPAPPAQEVTTLPAQPAQTPGTAATRSSPPPETERETAPPVTERDTAYTVEAVIIVVLILGLLALLFSYLFKWSHRQDQASYLGDIYRESVEEFEFRRQATVLAENRLRGEYFREVEKTNPLPDDLKGRWLGASPPGLDPWGTPPPGGSGVGGLGSFPPRPVQPAELDEYNQLRRKYYDWRATVEAKAESIYQEHVDKARKEAQRRAALATDVDLSTLRGRGGEFVLEFTTVVVIIFAAVVLGVLDILGTEQIGTLLAAIAGYVLGRATRSKPAVEAAPQPAPAVPPPPTAPPPAPTPPSPSLPPTSAPPSRSPSATAPVPAPAAPSSSLSPSTAPPSPGPSATAPGPAPAPPEAAIDSSTGTGDRASPKKKE